MTATWDDLLAQQQAAEKQVGYELGRLAREWVVPPFTILDSTSGTWRDRRRAWLALGIESELGRGDGGAVRGALAGTASSLINYDGHTGWQQHASYRKDADQRSNLTGAAALPDYADFGTALVAPGTSIFDPVLCELAYRWWCPAGGSVLDPFAGGSVRGIVAAMLGHAYTGVDLSADQVAANRVQAQRIVPPDKPMPRWFTGDSREVVPDLPAGELYDMVFTCPPYYDLEVYSDDPRDLSAMGSYGAFLEAYQEIIAAAMRRLRRDGFAVVVVSDVRDKHGFYVGLRRDTELAFERASAHLYNDGTVLTDTPPDMVHDVVRKWDEAKLVNAVGTLAMRTMNQMRASRKLGRQHQDLLCFVRAKPATHEWAYAREAPASPQQSMDLLPPDPPAPVQVPLLTPATIAAPPGDGLPPRDDGPESLPSSSGDDGSGASPYMQPPPDAPPPQARAAAAPTSSVAGLGPTSAPAPADWHRDVRAEAPPDDDEIRPPWVTAQQAADLLEVGAWNPVDMTDEDVAAMLQSGLWQASEGSTE